jgi:hypothetical protein
VDPWGKIMWRMELWMFCNARRLGDIMDCDEALLFFDILLGFFIVWSLAFYFFCRGNDGDTQDGNGGVFWASGLASVP